MPRKKFGVRSLPGTDDEKNLMLYTKPVILYNILRIRSQRNPYFRQKCLSYKIKANKKRTSNSGGKIIFNYMDCDSKILKTEVVENFSCSFCSIPCGGLDGVRLHLTSSHNIFGFNFWLPEVDYPEVDVSLKPGAFRFGELSNGIPFTFCSKRRKRMRSQRDDSNKVKRLNVHFLEMDRGDLPRDAENDLSHVNDDNVSSPPKAHSSEKTSDTLTITQPAIAESSEPKVPLVSRRKMLFAARSEARRIEALKKRQFYHSETYQPMAFEEVMSDVDSETEVDDEFADIEERQRLNQLVNVSDEKKRFMSLWNSFIRKQRVFAYGHVPWACEEFTKLHEKELITSQSFWQWRLFTIKLWNQGLICAKTIDKCNTFLLNSQAAAVAASSTSQATDNGNEQQPMDLDAE